MHRHLIAQLSTVTLTLPAFAHEGHGLSGAQHWHATDSWGLLALALAIAAAAWLGRGGK
jgi:hypothetical protein